MSQPAESRSQARARGEDPLREVRPFVAPTLSVVGLLIVAFVTLNLMNGTLPFVGGSAGSNNGTGNGNGNGNPGPAVTPAPSNIVVVPDKPEVTVPGSIVYAKAGNIWIQSGKQAHQLTGGGHDSMPSWSPDGKDIYFVRTTDKIGIWPAQGSDRRYQMTIPAVMRVNADGSGEPVTILDGHITSGIREWFSWIRQPVLGPDGRTLALVSDGPDPTRSDVVLQFYDLSRKKRTIPALSETSPLGHQDPAWRPDGNVLLYVRNDREGTRGAPVIYAWDVAKKTATAVTGPGYLEPTYSPDGRFIAATRTSSFGNDVVILDAANGREILRVTTDGASWAPVWSPVGDAIAYLHIQGQIVDLRMARLGGTAPDWTVAETIPLTEVSGLDGASRPDWFVPADQLPAPTPQPSPSASPASASPSASSRATSPRPSTSIAP
jgi:dipeptidyl aminopeptidase/acylaminoacyl peptidase